MAFLAGEALAFHRALGLKPWEFAWPQILTDAEEGKLSAEQLLAKCDFIEAELLSAAWPEGLGGAPSSPKSV